MLAPIQLLRPDLRSQPRARVFLYALLSSAAVTLVYSVGALLWGPGDPVGNLSNLVALALLALTTAHFCRTGHYGRSLVMIHVPVISIVLWNATRHGGVAAPDLAWIVLFNLTGVLFGGTRLGLWELAFVETGFLLLFLAQSLGWIQPDNLPSAPGPIYHWFVLSLTSSLTVAVLAHFNRTMERVSADLDAMRTRRISELDRLVEERTRQLSQVRSEIARDFHDEVGNRLAGIALMAERVRREEPGLSDGARDLLERIALQGRQVHREARDFVWSIDPSSECLGEILLHVLQQLETLAQSHGKELRVDGGIPEAWFERPCAPGQGRHLLLILKEAVGNACRHGSGTRVWCELRELPDSMRMSILNEGKPFDPQWRTGHGIANLRRRARDLGGILLYSFGEQIALHLDLPLSPSTGEVLPAEGIGS